MVKISYIFLSTRRFFGALDKNADPALIPTSLCVARQKYLCYILTKYILQKGGVVLDALPLQIQMLGRFVIRRGSVEVHISGRSRKLCQLLAFLIRERDRAVPCGELAGLLWPGEAQDAKALNALKAILHRARVCLNSLEEISGQALILNRGSCFQWDPQVSLTADAEEFARLCREAERACSGARQLELGLEALDLYQGDFLPMLTGCPWASAIAGELHRQYLQQAVTVLSLLKDQGRWQEAARIAEAALALEPCREDLCAWQMESLLQLERRQEAAQVYDAFQERLLSQSGVLPSDGLRTLCRQARKDQDPRRLTPDTLLERLSEEPRTGALLCDFDFFRVLCHAAARRAGRDNRPVHAALISLSGPEDSALPRHSLDRAMDNLQAIVVGRLRQGDAVTRYGASQFVVLLPQTGLEESRMVCRRLTQAFARQFPHSPAALSVSVQPLVFGVGKG